MLGYIIRGIAFLFLSAFVVGFLLLLSWAGIVPIDSKVLSGILAGILLVLVAFPFALWYFLKFKMKRLSKDLMKGLSFLQPLPMTIHLTPAKKLNWTDPIELDSITAELMKLGYERAGEFSIDELPDLHVRGFANPSDRSLAAIYEAPNAGLIVDLVQHFQNDETLTVTNAPMGMELDRNPKHVKRYEPGAAVSDLRSLLLELRAGKTTAPTDAQQFASYFEKSWHETMSWKAERGGHSEAEIRRIAISMNGSFSDDVIDQTRNIVNRPFRKEDGNQ